MTVPPFEHDRSEVVYVQIADHLAKRIEAGEFPPRSQLPTDEALAEEYEVSVETGRKAAHLLKSRHYIKITRKGKFVRPEAERQELIEAEKREQGQTGASEA